MRSKDKNKKSNRQYANMGLDCHEFLFIFIFSASHQSSAAAASITDLHSVANRCDLEITLIGLSASRCF